ncbi:uncharacterized protein LODBEIA_P55330 [Lodderomyces beijingensis]|uniref:Serine/threonine-protein kinase MEC1 n=1 Tax=Lodderomyces beijingensis TaxID=1775926 RepID=A0ABP0ZT39_9ASCO
MTTARSLSSEELLQFLSDIELNINDQDTDFQKLAFYLLQFLHARLMELRSSDRKEDSEIVLKLIDSIDLVLSKKLYLLNAPLGFHDFKAIHVPTIGGGTTTTTITNNNVLFYEWMISFVLSHLPSMCRKRGVLDGLKGLLFSITNLVATKLHSFKFTKLLRDTLTSSLESGVMHCLENARNVGEVGDLNTLVTTCHLFYIVNEPEVLNMLAMNLGGDQLRFEILGRKLWYALLEARSVEDAAAAAIVDDLTSLFLLNSLDSVLSNDASKWNQVKLILNRLSDLIIATTTTTTSLEPGVSASAASSQLKNYEFSRTNQSASSVLLKVFKYCEQRHLLRNFVADLGLATLVELIATTTNEIPNDLRCVIRILHSKCADTDSDYRGRTQHLPLDDTNGYSLSEPELNRLRFELRKEDTTAAAAAAAAVGDARGRASLEFIIKEELVFREERNDFSLDISYIEWIRHVRTLTKNHTDELKDDVTLFTLITALSKFPALSKAKDGGNACEKKHPEDSSAHSESMHESMYASIDQHRPPVKSTTESLIFDEILLEFFLKKLKIFKHSSLMCCNFLIMTYNYYSVYLPEFNDKTKSLLTELLDCLATHPNRSLRMLITRILPLYLIRDDTEASMDEIFKFVFSRVASIDFSTTGKRHFGESAIYALVALAHVVTGERLCAVFFKLIDWLGEPNDQHQNYVYCGFLDIAQSKNISTYKLLSPYFPSISDIIIKKSLLFERFLQVLGMNRAYFLSRTKDHTVSKLLEYHKEPALLGEIAEASNMSIEKLLASNLPRILASYLVRDPANEKYVVKVLASVCSHYKQVSPGEIFTHIGDITWNILLEIQTDEAGKVKNLENLISALNIVAKNSLNQKRLSANNGKYASLLIEEQMLLLIQKFSDVTHLLKGAKPYLERRASFQAILFLIRNHATALTSALGQLSTCLQATLEEPDLHVLTLRCWIELVQNLPSAHLISLIDIIISLIFRKFQTFGQEAQHLAIEILKKIYSEIKDKNNRYTLYYLSIPFLEHISDLSLVKEFRNMKPLSRHTIFHEFNRRLCTSNQYVVEQALFDLFNYCQKYQLYCQKEYFKDSSLNSSITTLVRTIMDTATHFRNRCPHISSSCAKVLAVIGALDANKFHFKSVQRSFIVQKNFASNSENVSFLVDLIENYVLKLFWASNDPHKQLFSAYAMQCFLTIMNLNETSPARDSEVWNRFGDVAKSTLTPLLNSKYAASKPKQTELNFPFFTTGIHYDAWLVELTSYLLKRACHYGKEETPNARQKIFQTCAILLYKDHDIRLCQHLLRYVVLSHILSSDTQVQDQILLEFTTIMKSGRDEKKNDEQLKLCFQTIFSVLDYLSEWLSSIRYYANYSSSREDKSSDDWLDRIDLVDSFVHHFEMKDIVVNSVECESYERTILYIEKYYREGHISNTDFYLGDLNAARTLQAMYANLNDYDTLNGVLKLFSTNNLKDKLTTFEYSDNASLAFESFKVLDSRSEEYESKNNTDILKALSDRGVYDEVLSTLTEKMESKELRQIPPSWSLVGLKSAVYSGNINKIKSWVEITDTLGQPSDTETLVNYELAKCLMLLAERDRDGVAESVGKIYHAVGTSLVPSVSSSFNKNVGLMNQLHTIYDLEDILQSRGSSDIWKIRLTNVDQDFDTQLRLLTTHIVASEALGINDTVSEMFLHESELARESGRLKISAKAIVKAMALNNSLAKVEYAKLLWDEGKQSEAIKSISETLQNWSFVGGDTEKEKAKAQLQYANWLDESNHLSANKIIAEYRKAFELDKDYESSYYDIGRFYAKLLESSRDDSGIYEHLTVRNYLFAISIGSSYIFEALPKLITVWLDFAKKPKKNKNAERMLLQIVGDVNSSLRSIKNYVWYTAITQILSRIVHDHEASFRILANIITNLIKEFPRHTLWFVISHIYSTDSKRKQRVETILNALKRSKKSPHGELILGAVDLYSKLIGIASKQVTKSPKTKQLSLKKFFGIDDASKPYDELVIPVQSNLQIRLPHKDMTNYTSFPKSASVTFDGFDDNVNIFFSLQMPRQITIRGSDGKPYRLMIKSDDTRKDAKVVEFTTMVNRILSSSTEARKRALSVANYSVIPLSEKIGVIEFVMDVQTMKATVVEERKRLGKVVNERKIFMALDAAQKFIKEKKPDEDGSKLQALTDLFQSILNKNEPVLHHWFVEEFSEPSSWYLARNSFTRSSAVMSIVGYLIGLGDRHCENLLFFKKTGSILHIDFDCLFEKGKTLPTPEVVPFRLTQNMVDAMGICGVEGNFRIACEVVGKLLRSNEQSLMNILENLLYDPLLDWKINQNPQRDLSSVRKKIRGLINEEEGLAMNVHGQVDVLIQEATSIERLSRMYGGWSAYI